MVFVKHCWFCSLPIATVASITTMAVVYLLAFCVQLWWLVDSAGETPTVAHILCALYLTMLLITTLMTIGFAMRRTRYLFVWMMSVVMLFLPEMGMVLFLCIYHWDIKSAHGTGDLIFYMLRAIINLVSLICVQSMYSNWCDEEFTITRLEALNKMEGDCPYVYHNTIDSHKMHLKQKSIAYNNDLSNNGHIVGVKQSKLVRSASAASGNCSVPRGSSYVGRCEFDASHFSVPGRSLVRMELSAAANVNSAYAYEVSPLVYMPHFVHPTVGTQSLDRRRYKGGPRRSVSSEGLNLGRCSPSPLDWGLWMPRARLSHASSLGAESDSYRYRDVAL